MSYYYLNEISILDEFSTFVQLEDIACDLSKMTDITWNITRNRIYGCMLYCDETRWSGCEDEMKKLTKLPKYKDVAIAVKSMGEERDDIATYYWKNGKCQHSRATITFEPFDEGKLA